MGRSGPSDDHMAGNKELRDWEAEDLAFYNNSEPETPTTTGGLEVASNESENDDDDDMGNEDDDYCNNPAGIADLISLANSTHIEEQALVFAKDDKRLDDPRTSSEYYLGDISQSIEYAGGDNGNNDHANMDLYQGVQQSLPVQQALEGRVSMTLPIHNHLTHQIWESASPHPGLKTSSVTSTTTDQSHESRPPYSPIALEGNASPRSSLDMHRLDDDDTTHFVVTRANEITKAGLRSSFERRSSERLDTILPADSRAAVSGLEDRRFPQNAAYLPAEDEGVNHDIYEEYRDHNGKVPLVSAADHAFLHEKVFHKSPENDHEGQFQETLKIPFEDQAQDEMSAVSAPAESKAVVDYFVSESSLMATALAQAQSTCYSTLPDNVHRMLAEEVAKIHLANDFPNATPVDDRRRYRNRRRAQTHETTQIRFADASPAATPPSPVDDNKWFGKHHRVESQDICKKGSGVHSAPAKGEANDSKKQLRRKRSKSMPHKMQSEKENPKHGFFFRMESFGRGFGHKVKHLGQMTSAHFKYGTKPATDIEKKPLEFQPPSTPERPFPAFSDQPMKEYTSGPFTPLRHEPLHHEPKSTLLLKLRGRISLSNFKRTHHDYESL